MNMSGKAWFNKIISCLMIVILAITGLITIKKADGVGIPGDGFEYLMMQISFQNHGSFDVTDDDIEDAKAYFDNNIFDTIYKERAQTTLIDGNNGKLYAKHFGLYSVLCIPLSRAFHFIGLNPTKAFMSMNLLFWIAALIVVLLCLKADEWRKTLLITFLVINPVYFYLSWVHTEVFIFAFVVMGLVFWNNRQLLLAMLFTSIAATCNLAVLGIAFIIGVDFIITEYLKSKSILKCVKKSLPIIACAIPGFIPVVMSFIRFGTYSPVAAVASVGSSEYPTDSRLWAALSYIFDPNQGMLFYSGIIVPVFFILTLLSIKNSEIRLNSILNLVASVLMLIIVAQELHINCGMAFIMRYNVWMLPLYVFFVVLNLKRIIPAIGVVGISSIWSFVMIVVMMSTGIANNYLAFTPLGKAFLNTFPTFYNPPVGIFYSRTLGNEVYYCEDPVAFRDEDGNVHKILVTNEAMEAINDGRWILVNGENASVSNICGSDFTYMNYQEDGVRLIPVENSIIFSDMTDVEKSYVLSDIGIEGENLLVYGNVLHIRNYMLPGEYHGNFGLSNVFGGTQQVSIIVNGNEVFNSPVSMDDDSIEFDFVVAENSVCDIEVNIPGALSPSSVNPSSTDDRILSLYLTDLTFAN